jgi:hypothetical protein
MENIENLKILWQNTFNRHAEFDESVLEIIQVHKTMEEFGKIPDKDEIRAAIKKMKYDKAPWCN